MRKEFLQIETKKMKQMSREAIYSRKNKNVFKNLIIILLGSSIVYCEH